MSAKLMYSLSDENPDLQKQIGCMNGFFQLFDRHRYLAAGRVNSHAQKRLPPPGQNGNQTVKPNNVLEKTGEKNAKKVVKEKRRNSTESPRVSFSSSCSSSFSSLDYNKTAHLESSPSSQTTFAETPSRDLPANHPIVSTQLSRKSFDLRDAVKDSMHREARGLLVKTAAKEEAVFHTLKYIDSPRPLEPTKSVKPGTSGLNDSFRVFGKLHEGSRNSYEGKDGRVRCGPKDLRRLSYDGRESQDALKSNVKFKELPRLSLDSRQSCTRGSIFETKSSLLNDPQMEKRNFIDTTNLQQEPGSSKRASTVIAKLMGLADPMPATDYPLRLHNTLEAEKIDPLSRSSRATKVNKQDHFSGSPRNSQDLTPKVKNADLVVKTTANQKIPIETAPWRQPQGNRGPHPPAFKCHEAPTKTPTTPLTVYGEIEKRLADLEFTKSGKDLRALKQILEAMQKTKETLDDKKDKKFSSGASEDRSLSHSSKLGSRQGNLQSNTSISPAARGSRAPKSYKSPIVIIKPTKLIGKNTDPPSNISSIDNYLDPRKLHTSDSADNRKVSVEKRMTKYSTPRNTQVTSAFNRNHSSQDKNNNIRTAKSAQTSKMTQSDCEENSGSSGRSSGTVSPRLQQRRFGLDKQSAPASPDSSRTRRQLNRQPAESRSPGRQCRKKSSNMQQSNDHLIDTRTKGRDLSHQGNTISLQSESNISLASDIDNEVTSIVQSDQNPAAGFIVNRTMRATSEQPSPVSVLDETFYRDESPSPVKKKSNVFKDEETPYHDEGEWQLMDLYHPSRGRKSILSTEADNKIPANIWAQNPQEMNCSDVEQIIADAALLCDSTNPDHIYISEILSASNLPRKLESGWMNIQCRSLDYLINPNLFFVLEQLKASTRLLHNENGNKKTLPLKSDKKVHRKLVFDVVNEILARKFVATDSSTQWLSPHRLIGKNPIGQQLLRDLCSEIDRLQGNNSSSSLDDEDGFGSVICEDMTHCPMNWIEYGREIPAVVLDVERLIFKDLITEVLSSEAAVLRGRSGGHCRQLLFHT